MPMSPCVALPPRLSGDAFIYFFLPRHPVIHDMCAFTWDTRHTPDNEPKTNPSCVASIARTHHSRHEQLVFYSEKRLASSPLVSTEFSLPSASPSPPRVATHRLSSSTPRRNCRVSVENFGALEKCGEVKKGCMELGLIDFVYRCSDQGRRRKILSFPRFSHGAPVTCCMHPLSDINTTKYYTEGLYK